MRFFALAGLALALGSCPLPPPGPAPEPTATPTPEPATTTTTTTTVPTTTTTTTLAPEPEPTPDVPAKCPPAAPPLAQLVVSCKRFASIVCDATPRVCDAPWCAAQGRPAQACCPFWKDDSTERLACESERALPITWRLNGLVCPTSGCRPHPEPTKLFVDRDAVGVVEACAKGGLICSSPAPLPR